MTIHARRRKRTGEALANKLDGGACLCPSADECRVHPQPGTTPAGASGPVTTGDQGTVRAAYTPGPWVVSQPDRGRPGWEVSRPGNAITLWRPTLESAERARDQHNIAFAAKRIQDSALDLFNALQAAIDIAEEARREWDAAPSGMRAGKLLIALAGGCPGYRADIDAIHMTLTKAGR